MLTKTICSRFDSPGRVVTTSRDDIHQVIDKYRACAKREPTNFLWDSYRTIQMLENECQRLYLLMNLQKSLNTTDEKNSHCEVVDFYKDFMSKMPIVSDKLFKHLEGCEFCSNLKKKIKSVKFTNGKESHYFTSIPFVFISHPAELWYLLWLSPHWAEIIKACNIHWVEYDQMFRMSRNTSREDHGAYGNFHPIEPDKFQQTIDDYAKCWKLTGFREGEWL
jgi:hypothetical protein